MNSFCSSYKARSACHSQDVNQDRKTGEKFPHLSEYSSAATCWEAETRLGPPEKVTRMTLGIKFCLLHKPEHKKNMPLGLKEMNNFRIN